MPTSIERLVWPELRAFRPDLHRQPAVLRAEAALRVLLRLTGDRKYLEYPNLYMCFPIEGTGNWYLVTHERQAVIRYDNAHGLNDLHCHIFDLNTGEGSLHTVPIDKLPTLDSFIRVAVKMVQDAQKASE